MISATITGRLGQDPEVKYLQNGTAVLELSIASSSAKKDADATWVRASIFGDRAEKLKDYLHKGDRVAACGTLELRKWANREGKEGSTLEMRIDQVDLIQDRRDPGNVPIGDQPSHAPANGRAAAPAAAPRRGAPF